MCISGGHEEEGATFFSNFFFLELMASVRISTASVYDILLNLASATFCNRSTIVLSYFSASNSRSALQVEITIWYWENKLQHGREGTIRESLEVQTCLKKSLSQVHCLIWNIHELCWSRPKSLWHHKIVRLDTPLLTFILRCRISSNLWGLQRTWLYNGSHLEDWVKLYCSENSVGICVMQATLHWH